MSLTQLTTRAQEGIQAPEISVEVHISNGLPAFTMVGLPEAAVRESRDRVRSAIINSGFEFPSRRITVNLAPADLPKEGGRYDLAIAVGILAASQQIQTQSLQNYDFYGELALSGECRQIRGLLPALIASKNAGQKIIIPTGNETEAAMISDIRAFKIESLSQLCTAINGGKALNRVKPDPFDQTLDFDIDLSEVYGQHQAKRALEIAASGGHHLLMMGPPGTGKSMLAHRMTTILPHMSEQEAITSASIRSISNQQNIDYRTWRQRPFQSPHHTVSAVALVGGGSNPKPGEISLAHHGVLFLDELTEFDRYAIETLREPLETGKIHISRASRQIEYPAQFQLVAAMNPCPGGCESINHCQCSAAQLNRYKNKLSVPFLDRIDIQIELPRLDKNQLLQQKNEHHQSSREVGLRVEQCRELQLKRQGGLNVDLGNRQIENFCKIDSKTEQLLITSIDKLRLSARSYHKLLRLARTIADMAQVEQIKSDHIAEAIGYRHQDRQQVGC